MVSQSRFRRSSYWWNTLIISFRKHIQTVSQVRRILNKCSAWAFAAPIWNQKKGLKGLCCTTPVKNPEAPLGVKVKIVWNVVLLLNGWKWWLVKKEKKIEIIMQTFIWLADEINIFESKHEWEYSIFYFSLLDNTFFYEKSQVRCGRWTMKYKFSFLHCSRKRSYYLWSHPQTWYLPCLKTLYIVSKEQKVKLE
jgi:hypothetical protein